MPSPSTYFTGKQLELARLINTADAQAVYQYAMGMSLEELNAYGKDQMTVLLYCGKKTIEGTQWNPVVTSLIRAGSDPLLKGLQGEEESTFLEWVMGDAYQQDIELLKAVLESGINPDTDSSAGANGPLISEVAGQDGIGAIRLLLEHGADVNRRDSIGGTAIQNAIATLGIDEVNYLLDHGANPKVVDYYGVSFAHQLQESILGLQARKDPRLKKLLAIRDRIIGMGVPWPPESPEQLRARVIKQHKQKTGQVFVFMPDEGYEKFFPPYTPAPVRKVPIPPR